MFLEVLIGSEEPITYPFNKKKLVLGSIESNDIVITASGVSRKHVMFLLEGDQYYVIDQGSTNGTFLNEERLVPGRKVEFNSFFPLRLGDNVLVTLLSESADTSSPEVMAISLDKEVKPRSDSTTRINIKNLKDPALTQKLVLETQVKRNRKKNPPAKVVKKKSFSIGLVPALAFLLVASAAYYNFFIKEEVKPERIAVVGEIIAEQPIAPPVKVPDILVPTDPEVISNLLRDLKCTTDVEKYLCEKFSVDSAGRWGAVQSGTRINVMLDGASSIEESAPYMKEGFTPEERKLITAAVFISRSIPELDTSLLGDVSLNFTLFQITGEVEEQYLSFAISPERLGELKTSLPTDFSDFESLSILHKFIKIQ